MAKGKSPTLKKTPPPLKPAVQLDAEVVQKLNEFRSEGKKLYIEKDYAKALEQYDAAIKVLPAGVSERTDLLVNKAACLYALNRYKDAVTAYGSALEIAPSNATALKHRAKALEKQGLFKAALTDIQAINKTNAASDDTRESERRLKDLVAGRRPSLANGGARAAGPGAAGSSGGARGARSPLQWPFSAKCTLNGETRLIQLTAAAGYADLLGQVQAKFPNAGPCVLKYVDKEGDLVTITSRSDVQTALAEALQGTDRRLGVIPPIKVQLVPAANKSEVPPVPFEELQETAQMLLQQHQQQQAAAAAAAAAQPQQKQTATSTPSGEVIEIDDWLVEFVNLFRDMSGIDADRHLDAQGEGWASLQRAVDATLRSEEALPLFDKAMERFKEVTASGYLQWGNVHLALGHRLLDIAALEGVEVDADLKARVKEQYAQAEAKYKQAMEVKPDLFDGFAQMASLEFDRAKLAARLLVKPTTPAAPVAEGEAAAASSDGDASKAAQEAGVTATKEALAKIKAADVAAAKPHMDAAHSWYKQAHAAAVAFEEQRKAEAEARQQKQQQKQEGNAANDTEAADISSSDAKNKAGQQQQQEGQSLEQLPLSGHAQVVYGNSLYEWSQILAAVGQEWRPVLDDAVARFKDAGCADTDIRNALKNHTQVDQLDLGPDPEPEPTPATVEQSAQQHQQHKPAPPEAKGLPKLERKTKDKATAAAQ